MKNKNTKNFNLLKKGRVAIPIAVTATVLVLGSFLLTNLKNNEERNISKVQDAQEALTGTEYVYLDNLAGMNYNKNVTIYSNDILSASAVLYKKDASTGEWSRHKEGEKKYFYLLGDVNQDGSVDVNDAGLIWAYLSNEVSNTLSEMQKKAADINGDGAITKEDMLTILYGAHNKNERLHIRKSNSKQ